MVITTEAVMQLIAEVPEGHRHLRTTVYLVDGTELVFQEATVAAMVRAYVRVKTHPSMKRVVLEGKYVRERKEGYAEWQLLEADLE